MRSRALAQDAFYRHTLTNHFRCIGFTDALHRFYVTARLTIERCCAEITFTTNVFTGTTLTCSRMNLLPPVLFCLNIYFV